MHEADEMQEIKQMKRDKEPMQRDEKNKGRKRGRKRKEIANMYMNFQRKHIIIIMMVIKELYVGIY